ncbi:hypothetical protein [Fibrobacter sp.]|nr:hypothetical protein [Fibrobacter sp.]MDD7497685.1 hypothetical protein [Fibrobacter sp.]MDY5723911.1 hypothetical protein [Fibrobacter sp.]
MDFKKCSEVYGYKSIAEVVRRFNFTHETIIKLKTQIAKHPVLYKTP